MNLQEEIAKAAFELYEQSGCIEGGIARIGLRLK